MALTVPPIKQGSDAPRQLAPAGSHVAVLFGVIDLGHQWKKSQYGDKWEHQVMFQWELSDEMMSDGRPFVVSRRIGLNMHEKAGLRNFLKGWLGNMSDEQAMAVNFADLVGRACMLTIGHEASRKDPKVTYANVNAIAPLSKRLAPPDQVNPDRFYEIEQPIPSDFPEWLAKLIGESQEHSGKAEANPIAPSAAPADADGDEIPF
jgi:hypothetical protein